MSSRSDVVNLARTWLGKNEKDGSYKEIIDIYNGFSNKPRNIRMEYSWPWCACTWSALAVQLGLTNIMPLEISCGYLIDQARKMGCWVEDDFYIPKIGDAILYDWDDSGIGDNTGWPDHVGVVDYINEKSGYMTIIEGNYNDAVKKRTISINGKYIRGFITPEYVEEGSQVDMLEPGKDVETIAREVIVGMWGNGETRKASLEAMGYDYAEIQRKVNEILNPSVVAPTVKEVITTCYARSKDYGLSGTYTTTANLYCRNDAGTNKKALCKIPKGTKVENYGFYTSFNGVKWLLIDVVVDGIKYTGFSSSQYLKK